ncbi:SusC/RagA family TonB-linked outer membrane protein [Pedobacter heparinus]|uniref:SusC/RagA family TonB-linked outer membrane protein n=1 Tax=Pedobacter heparinus TaxID=984 RepID=UPI00292FA079|nr:SusC/RagA family TonB-linked outer membrane protein [Pedobacter heparinus]
MRLTTVILIATLMQVSAASIAQRVTLKESGTSLQSVIQKIRTQTGYDFLFDYQLIEKAKTVHVNFQNVLLDEALDKIFQGQDLTYTIKDRSVVIKEKGPSLIDRAISVIRSIAKDLTVKGKVVDQDGKPLPNASIRVKGKSAVTNTNQNGDFELKGVDEDAVLLVSYVGFKTLEVPVKGTVMPLEIKLNVATGELEEINISTGYQQLSKERVTGSYLVIDNKTLNQQVGTNILQRIEGVASGVSFNVGKARNTGDKTNISIRGLSTINGRLDPLIVLDNFVYEGAIENINPNDIENVTILKDAAATSIYGARGGNGVIVLTTKKGRFNQKPSIEFNTNVIIREKPDLYSLQTMSTSDYVDFEEMLFKNGYNLSDTSNVSRPALSPVYELLLKRKKGLISKTDSASKMDAFKAVDPRDQYSKYFYQHTVIQQYSMNIRGGSNNMSWKISGNYDKNTSELDAKYNKLNFNFYNTYKPIKNLTLSLGAYYTNSNSKNGKPGYNSIRSGRRLTPYLKFADDDGNPLPIATNLREGYTDTAGAGKFLNWKYYPLEDYRFDVTSVKSEAIIANFGVNYEIFKAVSLDLLYQFQRENTLNEINQSLESFAARHLINTYSQLNRTTGVINYAVPLGGILSTSNSTLKSHNFRGQLNFNKIINDHAISAIVGWEAREVAGTGNGFTVYGYKKDPLSIGRVNYGTLYKNFVTGGTETLAEKTFFTATNNRFISSYANASYIFKGKYIASGSARVDGSNIFGANTNDRWKPLWSAGLGWNISKENFYRFDLIPDLTLKSTYGYSGNVDLSKSAVPVAQYDPNSTTGLSFARIQTLNNPELRWEQVGQWNIGLHFGTEKKIITGSVEYYHKVATDLYAPSPYDYTAWGSSATLIRNFANMESRGIDLTLNSKNLDRQIKWATTFLLTYNKDKTTKYNSTSPNSVGFGAGISPIVGKPLHFISGYNWAGLDNNGNPQGFLEGAKSINYTAILQEGVKKGIDGNMTYVGAALPTTFGNVFNSFSYKNFSLSANIAYKLNYYFRKSTIDYSRLIQNGVGHPDYAKRWQKAGDELITNVPSFTYPNNVPNRDAFLSNSIVSVLKADHIRLQFVNLSYTLNKKTFSKLPFDELQFYMNASNLGILWRANNEELDPDYYDTIRPSKTIAFGLRVNL